MVWVGVGVPSFFTFSTRCVELCKTTADAQLVCEARWLLGATESGYPNRFPFASRTTGLPESEPPEPPEPAGPVAPVAPVEPDGPAGPEGPGEPDGPAGPEGPGEPAGPGLPLVFQEIAVSAEVHLLATRKT